MTTKSKGGRTVQRRSRVRKQLRVRRRKKFKSIQKITTTPLKSSKAKKFKSIWKVEGRSKEQFKDGHEFQRRLHFREDWVLWRTFLIGKWRVNVFKANHAFEEFEDDHEFQRRLHFGEDWVLWRTFLIRKWRVNVFKANHAFEEFEDDHEFQRRLHFREDCVLCGMFSIAKWRVNVYKANHAFEEFEDDHEFQRTLHFREDWVLCRTFSLGKWRVNVFEANLAFEDDHEFQRRLHFREVFISEKIGYSGDRFRSGNGEWMYSKPTTPSKSSKMTTSFREDFISEKALFQRKLGTLENVFDREMKSECIQSQPHLWRVWRQKKFKSIRKVHFREDWVLWRTFSIGKWRVNVFKANHAFEEFEDDHELQRRLHFRFHFREDCLLCRTFSFGKWRVNVFKHTTCFAI